MDRLSSLFFTSKQAPTSSTYQAVLTITALIVFTFIKKVRQIQKTTITQNHLAKMAAAAVVEAAVAAVAAVAVEAAVQAGVAPSGCPG